jgi:uncharacterized protein (TIGR02145 family)
MLKNVFKSVLFLAAMSLFFVACQKSENETPTKPVSDDIVKSGVSDQPAIINGAMYQFEFQKSTKIKKGRVQNESTWITTDIAKVIGSTEQYQTMRVDRPNGSYFYVMIENLRYNPNSNGSWVYDNNPSNALVYGRLYNWQAAYDLKSKVYMQLPKTVNGVTRVLNRYAALPSIQDIKDILETTQNISNLPETGTDIEGGENVWNYYYDAFVSGLALTADSTIANRTLGGLRDNVDVAPTNMEFRMINKIGKFWLNESSNPEGTSHYPLSVENFYQNRANYYMAYINVAHDNRYGLSVRYVFYPW